MAKVREHVHDPRFREAFHGDGLTEALQGLTGFCIQGRQEEARRRDVNHALAVHLGIGHALPVVLPHGVLVAEGVGLAVGPEGLAALRVDGHHVAPGPGDGIKNAIHVGRRGASALGVKARAVPDPSFFDLRQVRRIDLIRRGRARVRRIPADKGPGAVLRAWGREGLGPHDQSRGKSEAPAARRLSAPVASDLHGVPLT